MITTTLQSVHGICFDTIIYWFKINYLHTFIVNIFNYFSFEFSMCQDIEERGGEGGGSFLENVSDGFHNSCRKIPWSCALHLLTWVGRIVGAEGNRSIFIGLLKHRLGGPWARWVRTKPKPMVAWCET